MDLKEIRQLIKMVETAKISEIEIEEKDRKIKISKNGGEVVHTQFMQAPAAQALPQQAAAPAATAPVEAEVKAKAANIIEVRSPMVGTFYAASSPDADDYTAVGKSVKSGDVLCIVEAMKLMNEIESEVAGKVVEVLVENAQPVEYNQVLFLIEKN